MFNQYVSGFRACLVAFVGTAVLSISGGAQAQTEEDAPGWTAGTVKIKWVGNGVKSEYRGKIIPAEAIYSGAETVPGNVAFTCYVGTFSASFAPEPADMMSVVRQGPATKNVKLRRPDVKINGEKIDMSDWLYMPELGIYRARKRSTSAKLYNAVIRGDKVEIDTRKRDYVTLNLPPVDRTFKQFGSECGLGTKAKKKS